MSTIKVKLIDQENRVNFCLCDDPVALARELKDEYITSITLESDKKGVEAAEEVYALSNYPTLQSKKDELYGTERGVSVGDIVSVDDDEFLCWTVGWFQLN